MLDIKKELISSKDWVGFLKKMGEPSFLKEVENFVTNSKDEELSKIFYKTRIDYSNFQSFYKYLFEYVKNNY